MRWENVNIGQDLPQLSKIATTQMLVRWAGASGDFNPLHYDPVFAKNQGVDRPIVQGALKRQWLIQYVTDWIGPDGRLKKFSCSYRGIDYPRVMRTMTEPTEGEVWWCKGKVARKYEEGDQRFVDLNLMLENSEGQVTVVGKALVILA